MKTIAAEQVTVKLKAENPWWANQARIQDVYEAYRPRPYLEMLMPRITDPEIRRASVLLGPRRVGKTVLLHHAIKRLLQKEACAAQICYISVDHPIYNGLSLEQLCAYYSDVAGCNPDLPKWVIFDEIQ